MTKRTRDDIDLHYALAIRLRDSGEMDLSTYQRCVLTLAHEHMKNGDLEDAKVLVNQCSEPYITQTLPEQIESDPEFGHAVHQLAESLAANNKSKPFDQNEFLLSFSKRGGTPN